MLKKMPVLFIWAYLVVQSTCKQCNCLCMKFTMASCQLVASVIKHPMQVSRYPDLHDASSIAYISSYTCYLVYILDVETPSNHVAVSMRTVGY